jgi:hypothetical protein
MLSGLESHSKTFAAKGLGIGMAMGRVQVGLTENPTCKKMKSS